MTTPKKDNGELPQRLTAEQERLALEDQQAIQKHKELERRAAKRIKPWGKPQVDDYDFRNWMKGATTNLLEAGCFYEYVRESRKLRGLLTLCKLARKRTNLLSSFEGLSQMDGRGRLGDGAFLWLFGFADQLAQNENFAELLRERGAELKRSLAKDPFDFPRSNAVKLAPAFFVDYGRKCWPPQSSGLWTESTNAQGISGLTLPPMYVPNNGWEKIAIEVCWRDFNNRQIGKAMERFARAYRPEVWKKPRRERPKREIVAKLKALSVLRIWKRFPDKEDRWERIEEVGECTGYKGCVNASRLEGTGTSNAANVEINRARDDVLRFFRSITPDEKPSNWVGES